MKVSRLGPYELQDSLGAGGMGEVYLALDTRLKREVAIKVLPSELSRDPARVARFEREARLTSQLNHPNIVALYDVVHEDGVDGLVMELVRGDSLREVLGRGAIPVRKAIAIGSSIADALSAAHGIGVVHRDLKPENVMLTREGVVKVLDFGLARESTPLVANSGSQTAAHLSHPGQVVGTAIYMSPEQASGEMVDFRSDQFSLGLLLYEMLAGRHPFQRATVTSTVAAIIVEKPAPSIETLSLTLPPSVERVLRRCLQKEPQQRYGSTLDLAHDLADAAEELDRPAGTDTHSASPSRWRTALPWVIAAAALSTTIIGAYVIRGSAVPPSPRAPIEASIDLQDLVFPTVEITRNLSLSPDGRFLLLAAMNSSGMPLRIQDLQTGELRTVEGTRNALTFTWSPDGRSIAYLEGGKLKRMEMDGSPPVAICDAGSEGMPTWGGDVILFPQYSPPAGIYRVSASGGTPQLIRPTNLSGELEAVAAMWPKFLPDGKHYLYVELSRDRRGIFAHRLMVASVEGGEPREVGRIASAADFAGGYLFFVRDGTLLAQRFDLNSLRLQGEAQPIARNVNYFSNTGGNAFSVAANGVLAWRVGTSPAPLLWMDRAGTVVGSVDAQIYTAPRIAPDGGRFAVGVVDPKQGTSDVWLYTIATGAIEKLTFDARDERVPVWSPDSGAVFYRSDGKGPPDVVLRVPGRSDSKSIVVRPGVQEPRDVSPDGRFIMFAEFGRDTAMDLWIAPADGSGEARPFVNTPFSDSDGRFSPDGKWVAYQSDVSGRPEIYVRSVEAGAPARMVSPGGGTRPRWSASSRELFYYSQNEVITSVPVAADGSVNPAAAVPLFHADLASFEPMPDGRRFLIQPAQDTRVPIRVLSDWRARLRDRPVSP